MELKRQVRGAGPSGGICIVGEAPGSTEVEKGVPFVGRAGQILRRKLREVGIDPLKVRFENVIERKLEGNDETKLYWDSAKLQPKDELQAWREDLWERIKHIRPKVIVAAGDTAMRALTYETSISRCQCYVIRDTRINNGIPIVPMYHPMFIGRQPEFGIWMNIALQKADWLAKAEHNLDPERLYHIEPTLADVEAFISRAKQAPELAIDIEKFKGEPHEITCIGIALSPTEAMCIPLAGSSGKPYWPFAEEVRIWQLLREILNTPTIGKIFQNFIFDCLCLSRYGLEVSGPITDTMELSNLINPELKKSLGAIAQVYLFSSPWKGSQDWSLKGATYKDLWIYNAKDCCYTYEIAQAQRYALQAEGMEDYYKRFRAPLYERIYEICARGWRLDKTAKEVLTHELTERVDLLVRDLGSLSRPYLGPGTKKKKRRDPENDKKTDAGEVEEKAFKIITEEVPREFNPSSPDQVKEVLQNMGVTLPRVKGKVSSDEKALLKINRKYGLEFIPKLLEYRHAKKLLTTYCDVTLDPDERYRFSVNIAGTKSGRLSSQMTPWNTGGNSQNIPKNFRHIVIPDEGRTLVQVDLSQAELRVVAWLAGEEKLIQMLDAGEDIHQFAADEISRMTGMEASRQLGKQANHAGNYGIGPNKFADLCLLKSGVPITKAQAQEILKARLKLFPAIEGWQQAIKKKLAKDRFLVTPLGRKRTFFGRYDEDLEREALSFIPQSVVVDVLNWGWIALARNTLFSSGAAEFLQQGHDSLLIQVTLGQEQALYDIINETFGRLAFLVNHIPRVIPWDISTGPNWRDMKDVR